MAQIVQHGCQRSGNEKNFPNLAGIMENSRSCDKIWKIQDLAGKIWKIQDLATDTS